MEENKIKKLTYSELEQELIKYKNAYSELILVNKQLGNKLTLVTDIFNVMPYFMDVIKNKELFDKDLVEGCSELIKNILLPTNIDNKEILE